MARRLRQRLLNLLVLAAFAAFVWFAMAESPGDPILVLAVFGVVAALLWVLDVRRKKRLARPPPGYCPICGYNLTGNVSGTCPECGTPFEVYASDGSGRHTREIRPLGDEPRDSINRCNP